MNTTTAHEDMLQCFMDPVRFAREILGVELWRREEELLRSVALYPRTAVKVLPEAWQALTAVRAWWATDCRMSSCRDQTSWPSMTSANSAGSSTA